MAHLVLSLRLLFDGLRRNNGCFLYTTSSRRRGSGFGLLESGEKNQLTGQSNRRGTHNGLWGFLIAQRLELGEVKSVGA